MDSSVVRPYRSYRYYYFDNIFLYIAHWTCWNHRSLLILLTNRNFTKHLWRHMRVCIVHCSMHWYKKMNLGHNNKSDKNLMCSFALNRKIIESIKLFLKKLLGFINRKSAANTYFVFKTFRYYLQKGAVLIMDYLKISWPTSIFQQVALLATMCFCLISTPGDM